MTINTIVSILLIAFFIIVIAEGIYIYLRDKTLNDIRADVYNLFLRAEHNPEVMASGKKKMEWVLSRARLLLPSWAQVLITDRLLEDVVEGWFRAIKDLLDDGKINKSDKQE